MTLVLASTSPYRRQLLERLGLGFVQVAPRCDEEQLKAGTRSPRALAEFLAQAKATSLMDDPQYHDATIIGSDQVACIDNQALGKPGSASQAVEQLQRLNGRSHELITAVCVIHAGQPIAWSEVTTLTMAPHQVSALERYVERDQPLDCAGAYKIEAGGIGLFSAITSTDHSAITGLPLLKLADVLRRCGYVIP